MARNLVSDLEGFLAEINEAVGSSKFYDDIELSVEGIARIISTAEPSEQGTDGRSSRVLSRFRAQLT